MAIPTEIPCSVKVGYVLKIAATNKAGIGQKHVSRISRLPAGMELASGWGLQNSKLAYAVVL